MRHWVGTASKKVKHHVACGFSNNKLKSHDMEALRYRKNSKAYAMVLHCLQASGKNQTAFVILLLLPLSRVRLIISDQKFTDNQNLSTIVLRQQYSYSTNPRIIIKLYPGSTYIHIIISTQHIFTSICQSSSNTMACTACWIWGSAVLGQNLHLANMWIVVETNRLIWTAAIGNRQIGMYIWVFPKIMVPPRPPNHPFNRVFHYKPSILGYPYFWKHPYIYI